MSDIVDITKNLPYKVSEVICARCRHRWIAVRLEDTKLRELECPNCTKQGYAIETGRKSRKVDASDAVAPTDTPTDTPTDPAERSET